MHPLADVLRDVVEPAVRAVFAGHEVTAVHLTDRPGRGWELQLVACGETYTDTVVQVGLDDVPLDSLRERLRSNLVDFVAESRFGWGQDREDGPPA